jgi:ABC-type sugar transport system permease subunit
MASIALPSIRPPRLLDASTWLRAILVWRGVHTVAIGAGLVWLLGAEAVEGPARIAGLAAAVVFLLLDLSALVALARRRHLGRTLSLAADYLTFVAALVTLLQTNRVFVGLDALGGTFSRGVPFLLVALLAWVLGGVVARDGRPTPVSRGLRWVAWLAVAAALVAMGLLPGLATFLARTASPLGLTLVLAGVVSWYLAWRTFQGDVGRELEASNRSQRTLDGLLFVSPNLLGFTAFFAGPLLFSLFVSLTEWDAFGDADFVGLGNYARILALNVQFLGAGETASAALPAGYFEWFSIRNMVVGARDVMFWTSIRNIVVFTLFALPLSTIPALFLATLLNSKAPGIKVFRAIYFIPSIAGVVAVALIWRQLFSATTGWLNYLISRFVAFFNGLPLLPELTDPRVRSSTSTTRASGASPSGTRPRSRGSSSCSSSSSRSSSSVDSASRRRADHGGRHRIQAAPDPRAGRALRRARRLRDADAVPVPRRRLRVAEGGQRHLPLPAPPAALQPGHRRDRRRGTGLFLVGGRGAGPDRDHHVGVFASPDDIERDVQPTSDGGTRGGFMDAETVEIDGEEYPCSTSPRSAGASSRRSSSGRRPRAIFAAVDDLDDVVGANVRTAEQVDSISPQPENFRRVIELQNLDRSLTNTLLVTLLVVGGTVLTSILGGYAFARIEFPGRDAMFLVYIGSIMVPS